MSFYIKVLTDYYHFLVGDLQKERKVFLMELLEYLLLKDEYGYNPFFEGENLRILTMLQWIRQAESPMSFENYIILQKWHCEDDWSDGELKEYFLHQRKEKEIKIIFDFDNASSQEMDILRNLDTFLTKRQRELKILNIHNGRYVDAKLLLQEISKK